MNEIIEKTNYIYLLQTREFISLNQNVFKIGMTTKENNKRLNQYPKGSILIMQVLCKNCKNMEKIIINKFKEIFKHRKDIGNEYFEGDYNKMIDIIYFSIQNERSNEECNSESIIINNTIKNIEIIDNILTDENIINVKITTYNELLKFSFIDKIIITNKITLEGYYKIKGQIYKKLYNKNNSDFDENIMDSLEGILTNIISPVYIKKEMKSLLHL